MIKSTVDDLKKGGGLRLTLPPGGGGVLSPTAYVCVCERAIHRCLMRKNSLLLSSSPTIRLTAPLSPSENGGLKSSSGGEAAALDKPEHVCCWFTGLNLKSSSPPADPDKDVLTDDKSSDPRHRLIDFLSDKGFDLIGHSTSDRENVASSALDQGERRRSVPSLLPFTAACPSF